MRAGIIDLGTNTFNLLVADLTPSENFKVIHSAKLSVRLGEGGMNNNRIQEIPFQRGIAAFEKHLNTAQSFGANTILAVATSAIRSADNGKNFVDTVFKKFNIKIEIASGDREAELIFKGVRLGVEMSIENSLIMDIGGGSTEFIIANKNGIQWKHSFDLGAARLLEKFKPSDPITRQEVEQIENYFDLELQMLETAVNNHPVHELLGSSGSFDSFAEMIAGKFFTHLAEKSCYEIGMDDFLKIYQILLKSNHSERKEIKGLIEMRIDMIVLASVFTHYILKKYKLKQIRLSTFALKEGVISELLDAQTQS